MSFSMGMGLSLSLRQSLCQKLVVSMPSINWSLVDAFDDGGDEPLRFKKTKLDVDGLDLEERLQVVDEANEIFRFAYTQARSESGKKGGFYKIPLMRDFNVEIDEIKIKIPKAEYDEAKAILSGAGRFQRIARAVPYHQLHCDVKAFVEESSCTLDDVVVVGVDRGGRLPSFIMRKALGKEEGYTLKVDQAGGRGSGDVDREKLDELISSGVLKEKFVLFVDSTVDSGRQIEILEDYFEDEAAKSRIGHKAWGVVGSNENGHDHPHHRNINWGLDPDESFEDDPCLMGVDYAGHSHRKVVECPSETSEAIKAAMLEVPRGVVLDISNLGELKRLKQAHKHVERALSSVTWDKACYRARKLNLGAGAEPIVTVDPVEDRKRLLVIGSGSDCDLTEKEAEYIASSLAGLYDAIAGTTHGNPGRILEMFHQAREGSAQLYQPGYQKDRLGETEMFGQPIVFQGERKMDFRENMVFDADAVLALGGGEGTLTETILAAHSKKDVYIIRGYGPVASYVGNSKALRKHDNLHWAKTLSQAVFGLQKNS